MMDPYYELRLRDEVIYLHSLWHQGPPRRNPNHNPSHNTSTTRLPPSNAPQFKKQIPKDDKPRGKRGKKDGPQSDPPLVSDVEWPCQETTLDPSSSASGWPIPTPAPTPAIQVPSAEEQARFAATQAQQKAVTAVEKFFADNLDSDDEEDNGGEEDDLMDVDGYEEYQFFLKLFTEDGELRGYYEKTCEEGDFCCLVCGGIGKRKIYKDRVALVQHSTAIRKRKKAHRAYAQVMCRVLGWDIDRLPTIILTSGNTLGQSLAKPIESQGNAEVAIAELIMIKKDSFLENVNNGEIIQNEVSDADQASIVPGTSNVIDANAMLREDHGKDNDVGNEVENNERKIPGI